MYRSFAGGSLYKNNAGKNLAVLMLLANGGQLVTAYFCRGA
jgi:hypothetical protein